MKAFAIAILLGIGVWVVFLWPKLVDLPKIGHVTEWTLTDVGEHDVSLKQKTKLITFFYTNCPDICPTTMLDLKDLEQLMMEKGVSENKYLIIAVSLDPTFDSKDRIIQYKEAFNISNHNWLFLRGTEAETKKFTRNFNFAYEKKQNGFLIHTTSMYVVDSDDQIRAKHDMALGEKSVNIEEIARQLIQLIEESN